MFSCVSSCFVIHEHCRRPKRPDQALYVPGALRQAKLNQLKQNPDTESSTNITENKEISKSNENSNDDVAGAIFTTPKDDYDCIKPGNSSVRQAKMDRSSYNNALSVSERAADSITEGTDSSSFDANEQHINTPSHPSESVKKRLQSENKEPNREIVVENDSGSVVVISENSSKAFANESDDSPQIRDEGEERDVKTERSVINDDQSLHMDFKTESCDGGNDCNRDVVVNCGISQTLSTTVTTGNDSVDGSLSTSAVEKCDDVNEETLVENISVPRQNQEMENSKTGCGSATTVLPTEESNSHETENQYFQDVPLLEANGDAIFVEQSVETEEETETREAADCSPVDIVSDRKVEQDESCSDSANKENSEVLTCTGIKAFGHKEEQECGVIHFEDVSASELTDSQSKVLKEEVIGETELRTSKATLMSICENTLTSENSPTVSLDVDRRTSSIDNKNSESEISRPGLGNSADIINKKTQAIPEKTEDFPESVITEINENVGELETEQQKTSKKKKGKKDKSKELKEDKIKSKEKGEKKKKKEKKSVKNKNDKEVNLDSEMQIKEEKKSKTKEQSTKQQNETDLSARKVDTGQELTGGSCSKNDDDIDDDDNWESNFDESGDCLNPDFLEEVRFL